MPTIETIVQRWPNEAAEYAKITDTRRSAFDVWMIELDAEHKKRGNPYGDKHIAEMTGAMCWFSYFEDGYSPSEALDDDGSYD